MSTRAASDDELFKIIEFAQERRAEALSQNGASRHYLRAQAMGNDALEAIAWRELGARWRQRWRQRWRR